MVSSAKAAVVVDEAPSYHQQFANLKGCKDYDVLNTACPKPSFEKQQTVEGAHEVLWSGGLFAKSEQRPLLNLETKEIPPQAAKIKNAITCLARFTVIAGMHLIALTLGPR